jgi:membrane associated rhomboid family serine protease
MIPIRDHNPSGRFPFITYMLIGINSWVFFQMFTQTEAGLMAFINQYALFPNLVIQGQQLHTLITSMFLHGGIGHIVGNMLFLYIFGDNLEDRLGHVKFLVWYLFCGIAASALQIIVDPTSSIPNVGASGAIAGVMGGYLVLFPKEKIDTLIPLGFFFHRASVPAYFMLFYWFVIQLFSGAGSIALVDETSGGGVAYFAHVGGFLAGFLTIVPFKNYLRSHHARWF